MKSFKPTIAAGLLAISWSGAAHAITDFNIDVVFAGGLTESQQAIFAQAESYWESVILGYKVGVVDLTGVTITALGEDIDGAYGVLGSAGPSYLGYATRLGTVYSTVGQMRFDTADLIRLENNGSLLDVIKHEMAHVIGFGTLWEMNGLYDGASDPGRYTGSAAVAAYNAEFGNNSSNVPVELGGGSGTADAHWNEVDGGGAGADDAFRYELMSGWLNTPSTVSNTTIQSFADLGYVVLDMTAVPLPASGLLLLGALGGIATARRRRP
ncbi:VPLPA-CTERM sorting domain-containing protein [Tropicimonas sp. IMCC6043]|uniref:VPLPA-CTERM sorting domain-containing protein n=1 Tax=Tropicimonas sp. IMCC6043 TaxID=2510645 RepID=UPI00101B80E2|nr:VPLPA-CTERM sorting domain-containing protein [Tropicimonas sp. IMCC6043]RYH09966.1 VPLPA-CTERM sorting domain-containing protein [Tropicimonas sp. IMCC6043]